MSKSEKERVRVSIAALLSSVESLVMPYLEAVEVEASTMLRDARDMVSDNPSNRFATLDADYTAYVAACQKAGVQWENKGSMGWILVTGVHAVMAWDKAEDYALARTYVGDASRVVNAIRKREEEQSREKVLGAYQEAFWAMRRGEKPIRLSSGEEDRRVEIELWAPSRACGGIVIAHDSPVYASDWSMTALRHPDAYVQDLGRLVQHAVSEANKRDA